MCFKGLEIEDWCLGSKKKNKQKKTGRVRDRGSWSYDVQGGRGGILEIDQLSIEDAHIPREDHKMDREV